MKKILIFLTFLLLVIALRSFQGPNKALAQETTFSMCGGIQGLVCDEGYFCEYSDGSRRAPHPDASGVCKPNTFDCAHRADGTNCQLCSPCPTGRSCAAVCTVVAGKCQGGNCNFIPTATPTNTPTPTPIPAWNIAPVTAGTEDLCTSLVISDNTIGPGDTITATAKSTSSDIVTFGWWIYNMDNLTTANAPKPIKFVAAGTEVAGVIRHKQIADNEASLVINFYDVNRRDLNWNYYMPKPKRIRIDAYFKKVGATAWSKYNANCSKVFNAATVDPTPTPVSTCTCAAAGTCATTCFFDKFGAGVAYTNPVKCNLGDSLFSSDPTNANKNQWCRNYMRTRGDANGDGKASILDYFYYVSATVFGAKLPPTVNIDFNGDGVVSSADKAVLMKSLRP